MRFTFIADHTLEFHVTTMCGVLKVSKAGYYAWVKRPPSARAVDDEQLAAAIKVICEKRVARIMREEGLRGKTSRGFHATTDSKHAYPIAPNSLDR